ncbi:IclR family transcriptional regulator [Labedaea rhizosphaerae]|uniref:IclR family transcriptional regulator n=1 Tax=Labedaea rhizosphaerae TaxID=598644 RepID=A0A4R6SGR3_LABRH|nr:IclR family transcriptional regulator [Labedaea rhizosphaerae]TDQ00823.1 IclR family transcriptional regulator [Labedaea rhizosphaerae]
MPTLPQSTQPGAQTLDRGLQLLEFIAMTSGPVTVAEAAAALGVHRTIAHRLVATLTARGYLYREPGGGYRLGGTCLTLAAAVADLRTILRPALEELARETDETVGLAVLRGTEVVFVDSVESTRSLRVAGRTGQRLPAHQTAAGIAWLAELPADRRYELFPDADLDRAVATVRRHGYAHATNEDADDQGFGSFGAVVRSPAGEPRAAVSVAIPLARLTPATRQTATKALTRIAAAMSVRLA